MEKESLTGDYQPKQQSNLKKMGKWVTIALFVGAVSYSVVNQEPELMSNLLEEEAGSIDNMVENPRELVSFYETNPIEEALASNVQMGCMVNINRLNDQDKCIADWNKYVNSKTKYEDETFPARKDYALYWADYLDNNALEAVNGGMENGGGGNGYKDVYEWKRPSEFDTSRSPSLWGDKGILPHGVNQGGLGNCYFLAAAAAMAEKPERVQKLFQNEAYSKSGIFMINMYNEGMPVSIVVDDRLPVYPNPSGRYVEQMFNAKKSPNNAWWGPILEKSFCKMNIACTYTSSGSALESFRTLTGYPTEQFQVRDQTDDEFFKIVNEAINDEWMIIVGTENAIDGLASGHAYSIQDTATYKGEKLIRLRNPWGQANYNGPWNSEDTSRWTADAKRQMTFSAENNGLFWMPVSLYRKSFGEYVVCMYQDWNIERFNLAPVKAQTLKFDIKSTVQQEMIVTLDWQNDRQIPPGCKNQVKHNNSFNIFVREKGSRQNLAQKGCFENLGYGYYRFEGGIKANVDYEIEIYDFNGSQTMDVVVTTYAGKQKVELRNASH